MENAKSNQQINSKKEVRLARLQQCCSLALSCIRNYLIYLYMEHALCGDEEVLGVTFFCNEFYSYHTHPRESE
jgi:hypothetical protein